MHPISCHCTLHLSLMLYWLCHCFVIFVIGFVIFVCLCVSESVSGGTRLDESLWSAEPVATFDHGRNFALFRWVLEG